MKMAEMEFTQLDNVLFPLCISDDLSSALDVPVFGITF